MGIKREFSELSNLSLSGNKARARTARDTVINKLDLGIIGSDMIFTETLENMLKEYVRELEYLKQVAALSEEGSLIIRKRNRNVFYSAQKRGKEKGISHDDKSIYSLARRRFAELRIAELKGLIEEVEKILDKIGRAHTRITLEQTANRFADSGLDMLKVVFSEEQNRWIDESYTPNPYHQENLVYQTESGIFVRSNGELKIARALEQIGIPYRSDDMVQIRDKKTGKVKTYFVDFKVPNFRGGISMLEHLGGFSFEGYSENAIERLNAYSDSSEINNREIFWSFESTVNDSDELKKLIYRMLMPLC